MKLTFDVPDSTNAVSIVITYYNKNSIMRGMMMHNKLLVMDELKDGAVYTFEQKEGDKE